MKETIGNICIISEKASDRSEHNIVVPYCMSPLQGIHFCKKSVFLNGFRIYILILIYDYRYVLGASNLTEFLALPETEVKILGTKTSQEKIQKNTNKFGLILPNKRTLDYFKSLNKSIILDLLNLFKPDFELFQYDIGSIF